MCAINCLPCLLQITSFIYFIPDFKFENWRFKGVYVTSSKTIKLTNKQQKLLRYCFYIAIYVIKFQMSKYIEIRSHEISGEWLVLGNLSGLHQGEIEDTTGMQ